MNEPMQLLSYYKNTRRMETHRKRKTTYTKSGPISFRLNNDELKTLKKLTRMLKVSQSRVLSLALAHFQEHVQTVGK